MDPFSSLSGWPYPGLLGEDDLIAIHHVGGRGGASAVPADKLFNDDFVCVAYDADSDCLEDMATQVSANGRKQFVLPYCLADKKGRGQFRLMLSPYPSSMLRRGEASEHITMHCGVNEPDWPFAHHLRTMEVRDVETTTLDDICEVGPQEIPSPNVLILDTQGTEMDVVRGGVTTIRRNTLVMIVECSLYPFYENQALFGQVLGTLDELGFRFTRFPDASGSYNFFRPPLGLHSRGMVACADGVFFRRPETLLSEPDPIRLASMLAKLAFLGVAFNELEFTFKSLALLNGIGTLLPSQQSPEGVPQYVKFIQELNRAYLATPKIYRDLAVERLTTKELRAGTTSGRAINGLNAKEISQRLKTSESHDRSLPQIRAHLTGPTTALEDCLITNSFEAQALDLRQARFDRVNGYVSCIKKGKLSPSLHGTDAVLSFCQPLHQVTASQSWMVAPGMNQSPEGGLSFASSTDDPFLILQGISFNPKPHRYLVIRLSAKAECTHTLGQFYWVSRAAVGFAEECSIAFPVVCDNVPRNYVIDLSYFSATDQFGTEWSRATEIVALRLDPLACVGAFSIEYLGFIPTGTASSPEFRATVGLHSIRAEVEARWTHSQVRDWDFNSFSHEPAPQNLDTVRVTLPDVHSLISLRDNLSSVESALRPGGVLMCTIAPEHLEVFKIEIEKLLPSRWQHIEKYSIDTKEMILIIRKNFPACASQCPELRLFD